ncbi:MAG: hypothetical protein Q8840_00495 [Sweet potato little leaf phytoplasma]|nr:hypothetical protein [Sweet potato little leaf phytoplasma]
MIKYQNNLFLKKKQKLLQEFKNNVEILLGKEKTEKILLEHQEYLNFISNKNKK